MSDHTPGPWESEGKFIYDKYGEIICRVEIEPDREGGFAFSQKLKAKWAEQNANIAIIKAAPDLLAVLKACSDALKSYKYGNSSPNLAEDIADMADAAIAKATTPPEEKK